MFATPKQQLEDYVPPAEDIEVPARYLFRLVKIQDMGISKFDDPDDPNASHRLRWTFRMGTLNKKPILNANGDPYEHSQYTSNRTGKGKKTAIARQWIEALLGREVDDSEVGPGLERQLINKVATGAFDGEETTSQEGVVYTRYSIIRLSPYGAEEVAPAPKTAPAKANPPMKQAAAVAGATEAPW